MLSYIMSGKDRCWKHSTATQYKTASSATKTVIIWSTESCKTCFW